MHTTFPAALPRLLRRRSVPGVPGAARDVAGVLERRHQLLGAAQVRGHPLRVEQPGHVHLDQGHHHPRPGDAEPGAGGQPHLHRPAAAPAAAQADQLGVHPAAGGRPRAEDPRDRARDPRRHRTRFGARVRRRDRRSPAHPHDRRADRRPARRLGAIPGLVGRGHRNRRPGDRTRHLRGHRPALRVLPKADRGQARRSARRHAVGSGRRRDRRSTGSPTKTCSTSRSCCWWPATKPPAI